MPNKLLGQHFLKDPHVAEMIVRAVAPLRGETIFEIGPGHGELTAPLAAACNGASARLIVIEKDRILAQALEKKTAALGIKVVAGDALALLPAEIAALGGAESGPFKITGNIPYYISGHLLRIISELAQKPARCVLMVQKEVAERITAAPPKMNRLAASVQFWADPKIIMRIPRADFHPMPQVDSAVIMLETKPAPGVASEAYYKMVRALFAQPRKTVLNNVAAQFGDEERSTVAARIQKAGIDPAKRPQDLSLAQITALATASWG